MINNKSKNDIKLMIIKNIMKNLYIKNINDEKKILNEI